VQSYFPRDNKFKIKDGDYLDDKKFAYNFETGWSGYRVEGSYIEGEFYGFSKFYKIESETGLLIKA
jgi:hypothetical protein